MKRFVNKYSVVAVVVCFQCYLWPGTNSHASLDEGRRTADEAARLETTAIGWTASDGMRFAGQQPDTSAFDFPEEDSKHLYRDITVFVIVAAFAAFFIIKVFLQGDTDGQPEEDSGGKTIPN